MQFGALGRITPESYLKGLGHSFTTVGPSPIPLSQPDFSQLRALTKDHIKECRVELFAQAARTNAVTIEAGFYGVELHGHNGYIIETTVAVLSWHW
jgi:2,4-dienoyl-CoA reductase-like NADH-dependent reductase (Old Yellow Enzyme family)